jgi:hypothetical protein
MANKYPMVLTMKMGYGSNNANLIGWYRVVRRLNLKEGDNILFSFNERDDGELHLLVEAPPGQ